MDSKIDLCTKYSLSRVVSKEKLSSLCDKFPRAPLICNAMCDSDTLIDMGVHVVNYVSTFKHT